MGFWGLQSFLGFRALRLCVASFCGLVFLLYRAFCEQYATLGRMGSALNRV